MFGESDYDRRDHLMGLAGFAAGVHALRILAEKGIASRDDIAVAQAGITAVLDQMPPAMVEPELLSKLQRLIDNIGVAADEALAHREAHPDTKARLDALMTEIKAEQVLARMRGKQQA